MIIITILGWAAVAWLACGVLTFTIVAIKKGAYKKAKDWFIGLPMCLAIGPFGIWLLLSERN